MECYFYLRNVQELLSDGNTPHERRLGEPFGGPNIPFGSMVECHPILAKDRSRLHQFSEKVQPGIFIGYASYAEESGKEILWSRTLRSWTFWMCQTSMLGDSTRWRFSC